MMIINLFKIITENTDQKIIANIPEIIVDFAFNSLCSQSEINKFLSIEMHVILQR